MTRRVILNFLPFCALLLTGCPKSSESDTAPPSIAANSSKDTGAFKDLDPWILKTTDPNANRGNHGIYLSNGTLGATFGSEKDVRAFLVGGFDKNEILVATPNWHVFKELPTLKAEESYSQELDLKRGVLTTKLGKATIEVFLSAAQPKEAWFRVTGAPLPENLKSPKIESMVGANVQIRRDTAPLPEGWIARVQVEAAATPKTVQAANTDPKLDFDAALKEHTAVWNARWSGHDIVIEGDPEAQQLVHKLMFDLMQSFRPDGSFSIAPEALSGNFYKGHIFWDAEVWMFPALLAQHPDLAKTMLAYRFSHLAQAKAQAAKQGCKGIDFPWESAASGNETAPGGFSEGRHVTAGVGWATWQYWLATGDKAWLESRGWPLLSGIAEYFASKVKKNVAGGYDLGPLTGPDELHMKVTNNAYTNAMVMNCLNAATEAAKLLGKPTNPLWASVAKGLLIPKNADGVILRCDGDEGKPGTKQADGELLLWPAQHPDADAKTFDFHKKRPIKNGPAMTDSVHALIAARLGRADEAEEEFRASYRPFVRGPFLLFSEKRSLDRCVFTTGCGGVLQAVLYGFGGLDFTHWETIEKAPVALPKGWTKLEIQGVSYKGKRYTLTVTPQGRTLTAD